MVQISYDEEQGNFVSSETCPLDKIKICEAVDRALGVSLSIKPVNSADRECAFRLPSVIPAASYNEVIEDVLKRRRGEIVVLEQYSNISIRYTFVYWLFSGGEALTKESFIVVAGYLFVYPQTRNDVNLNSFTPILNVPEVYGSINWRDVNSEYVGKAKKMMGGKQVIKTIFDMRDMERYRNDDVPEYTDEAVNLIVHYANLADVKRVLTVYFNGLRNPGYYRFTIQVYCALLTTVSLLDFPIIAYFHKRLSYFLNWDDRDVEIVLDFALIAADFETLVLMPKCNKVIGCILGAKNMKNKVYDRLNALKGEFPGTTDDERGIMESILDGGPIEDDEFAENLSKYYFHGRYPELEARNPRFGYRKYTNNLLKLTNSKLPAPLRLTIEDGDYEEVGEQAIYHMIELGMIIKGGDHDQITATIQKNMPLFEKDVLRRAQELKESDFLKTVITTMANGNGLDKQDIGRCPFATAYGTYSRTAWNKMRYFNTEHTPPAYFLEAIINMPFVDERMQDVVVQNYLQSMNLPVGPNEGPSGRISSLAGLEGIPVQEINVGHVSPVGRGRGRGGRGRGRG